MKLSAKPTKQRKHRYEAALHIKGRMLSAHLSEDLSKKHNKRALRIRKGDRVKIMRGQFKGKSGKVEEVNIKTSKLYIEGIEVQKKEGTKIRFPIYVSNVMITDLDLSDKKRQAALKRVKNG